MARRGPRYEIELVDDDAPRHDDASRLDDASGPWDASPSDDGATATRHDAPGAAAGRPRRRVALLVGAALVAVLAVTGVVGQVVVDRREQAVVAAVAAHGGGVPLLTGAPEPLWTVESESPWGLDGVRAGDLLVGVAHTDSGPVAVRARDVATGSERWRTELVAGTTRAEVAPGTETLPYSGVCVPAGSREHHVVCWVDDGVPVIGTGDGEDLPASVVRVVTLDARDGSVVTDVADALDALEAGAVPTSFAAVGDAVVVTVAAEGAVELVAVQPDGAVAWRTTVPAPPHELFPDQPTAGIAAAGDLLSLRTTDALRLLDARGRTVRTVDGGEGYLHVDPVTQDVLHVSYDGRREGTDSEHVGTTTLLRPGGDVQVDGMPLHLVVDDGSVPGVVLTGIGARVAAWDVDGVELWSRDAANASDALVVDGRVHLDAGTSVVTLDARTGAELWTSEVIGELPVTDGRHLLAVAAAAERGVRAQMVALDPATGEEMWRAPVPDGSSRLASLQGLLVAVDELDGMTVPRLTILG